MVDRIDKTDSLETWKVQSTDETYKDREGGGAPYDGEPSDSYSQFQEKTDWNLLFDKSKLWKKNIQFAAEEIENVYFRKLNLKTDPSLLRIQIHLKTGEVIDPAFLAIPRAMGFKLKHFQSGNLIPLEILKNFMKQGILSITIPTNQDLFKDEVRPMFKPVAGIDFIDENTNRLPRPSGELLKQFNLVDAVTGRLKTELILSYAVAIGIFGFILWSFFYLN